MNIATYPVQTIWGTTANMNYRVGTSDRDTIDAIMVHDEYMAKTFTYQDGDIFIDLGSHIGAWTILMAIKNPTFKVYCVDEETEILTKHGFKFFNNVTYDDKIATLNPQTHYLEYQIPTRIISSPYKGEMIGYDGRINFLVTPNHKLYISRAYTKIPQYHLVEASKIFNMNSLKFKTNAKWRGTYKGFFYLPIVKAEERKTYRFNIGELTLKNIKKIPMNLWVQFMGWYLSEGCYVRNKKGSTKQYLISIGQEKIENRKDIIRIIDSIGFNYSSDPHSIRINSKQLWTYLRWFGRSKDKYIPQYIKDLPPDLLKLFIECYLRGDGYKDKSGNWYSVSTISRKMSDDLSELFLKIGKSSSLYISKQEYRKNLQYVLYIRNKILEPQIFKYRHKPIRIDYEGMVYCVTVPNHIIYIRRSGKSMWIGNSFEPLPENYDLIKKNILYNYLNNVYSLQRAVSDVSGKEESIFYTDDSTPFGAMHKYVGSGFGGSGEEIKVTTMGLNEILDMVPKVRVLKTDAEGAEVKGFPHVTPENMDKIDFVIGEFHPFLGWTRRKFFELFAPYFDDMTYVMKDAPSEGFGDFLYRNKRVELGQRLEELGYW